MKKGSLELVEHLIKDQEKLLERTSEFKRSSSADLNILINKRARALASQMLGLDEMQREKAKVAEQLSDIRNQLNNSVEKVKMSEAEFEKLKLKSQQKINEADGILSSLQQDIKSSSYRVGAEMYNALMKENTNSDEVFKFKLWALDLDKVKNADKEIKSDLRKVKSIFEGFALLNSLE